MRHFLEFWTWQPTTIALFAWCEALTAQLGVRLVRKDTRGAGLIWIQHAIVLGVLIWRVT